MSLENEVTVLFEGYSKCISDQIMHANCTCVLIQSRNACIVVDTLTSWDGDQLTAGKRNKTQHLKPEFLIAFLG